MKRTSTGLPAAVVSRETATPETVSTGGYALYRNPDGSMCLSIREIGAEQDIRKDIPAFAVPMVEAALRGETLPMPSPKDLMKMMRGSL